MSEHDPWAPVLRRLEEALADAGIPEGPARIIVLEALRGGLEAAHIVDGLGGPGSRGAPAEPRAVSVVPGGRDPRSPRRPGPPPDLRLAPPASPLHARPPIAEAELPPDDVDLDALFGPAAEDWSSMGEGAPEPGGLVVAAEEWETLVRAAAPWPYRLRVVDGRAEVRGEGLPADIIAEGNTLDLTAASIHARAVDGLVTLRFVRLRGPAT